MTYPITTRVSFIAWPSGIAFPIVGWVAASLLAVFLFGIVCWQAVR